MKIWPLTHSLDLRTFLPGVVPKFQGSFLLKIHQRDSNLKGSVKMFGQWQATLSILLDVVSLCHFAENWNWGTEVSWFHPVLCSQIIYPRSLIHLGDQLKLLLLRNLSLIAIPLRGPAHLHFQQDKELKISLTFWSINYFFHQMERSWSLEKL